MQPKSHFGFDDISSHETIDIPPGEFPFRRGIHPTMYRGRLWTMRQYAGYGTALDTNERYHYLLDKGQTGLSVAFDLPTQLGLDSDHPLARGEVGRVGVAISTIDDMATLLHGIPLAKISLSMTINATAPILLAMYVALANRQGIGHEQLSGTVQNDVLKEYIARGNYIFDVQSTLKLTADVIEFCSSKLPRFNSISISGYHIREAGSTAVQELAFTFANAIAYVDAAISRGLSIDEFAPRLSFFFNSHRGFLEEIAKFRAARLVWARLMRERYEAEDSKSWKLRFHTQTAGSTLTRQQPLNNVVRVALQALAAVFGGTQSLHTNSYDEAVGLPSEEAATLALRTQQILAFESGVPEVVDALGGSFAIETMTDTLEREVWEELDRIEQRGGASECIRSGYFQRQIEESAYAWQTAIENSEIPVVGVNTFSDDDGLEPSSLRVDPAIESQRQDILKRHKDSQDTKRVADLLETLKTQAREGQNLMPHLIRCVDAGVTLGQLVKALQCVYRVYEQP